MRTTGKCRERTPVRDKPAGKESDRRGKRTPVKERKKIIGKTKLARTDEGG